MHDNINRIDQVFIPSVSRLPTFLGNRQTIMKSGQRWSDFVDGYLKRIIFDDSTISYINELVIGNKVNVVTQEMS